jgi:hypothetical protein
VFEQTKEDVESHISKTEFKLNESRIFLAGFVIHKIIEVIRENDFNAKTIELLYSLISLCIFIKFMFLLYKTKQQKS